MGLLRQALLVLVTTGIFLCQTAFAADLERRQAKRIHDRLTGVAASNATIDQMETLLGTDPSGKSAANYAITTSTEGRRGFYNVTLKNFAAPWTNEDQTVFTDLNDYIATVIGMVRDGIDFRQVLSGDIIYRGNNSLGIPAYSNDNNNHYQQLEALGPIAGDLASTSVLLGPNQGITQSTTTGLPASATAGIMTSRAGAMAYFFDGTNRAMFRFTLMNHLCTDLEPMKDNSRTPNRVRRDVSRSPGGDSRIYLNNCVGCHAGMDGMAGAFAHYEWVYNNDQSDGHLEYRNTANTAEFDPVTGVALKYHINAETFEHGYNTIDDSWVNYWRNGPNSVAGLRPGDTGIGWGYPAEVSSIDPENGYAFGNGARSLGVELANSKAFAQCQVDKVFKAVCLRDPNVFSADRTARDGIVTNFVGAYNYDMREVFTDTAAYCKGN